MATAMTKVKEKKEKFIIVDSFDYRGYEGKNKSCTILSPGEEIPKLSPNERERLKTEGKIEQVDMNGERINAKHRDEVELKPEQAQRLVERSPARVAEIVQGTKFTKDSLVRMLVYAEKNNAPKQVTQLIEARIDGRL